MHRYFAGLVATAFAAVPAISARADDTITSVTREQVATILRDNGYRAELVHDASSGAYIRTGIGGHTVVVAFFNCAAENCAAIQFWTGFKPSPKFTQALAEKWNTEIRYAKLHLTDDGGLHVEYDVYLAGGVSSGYMKAATQLYGNLLSRLDEFVRAAPAGPAPQKGGGSANVEALAAQGKYSEAIAALDDTAALLWEKAPLTFRRALWVAAPPQGYGAYNPRESNVFASGAPMTAYVEPVGFGWRRSGDLFETDLAVDLTVKGKDGAVLLHKDDFQNLRLSSRVKNREFMAHLTYTFSGIRPGEYVAETTVRDKVTGKRGTFSLPFAVR